jgi:hypothetical protein
MRFIVHPPPDDGADEPADFPSYNPADDIPPF